ncbi:MAG: YccS family putative transporter [Formivibrio sp.]|nr:YccS family putative transporter [Formivibrio sp.]
MQINSLLLRRLWSHNKTLDSLKVALGFGGVLVFCFGLDHKHWLVGLILGVIAAALAETQDRFIGRVKALLVMLLCFAVVAFSVRLLFPYPWLFAFGLAVSTFLFVMLGALGERYATIATASVILAIYTMLGISQHVGNSGFFWQEPVLLLSGAAWYGCISLLAVTLFRDQPVRQAVARVFEALSGYLEIKAGLLEPVRGRDINTLRITLATQNGRLVGLMNLARQILVQWAQSRHPARGSRRFLLWYFLAQDVHERASSAHHPYSELADAFARSDVLFRCQRLLNLQAKTCRQLSEAIAQGEAFHYEHEGTVAFEELNASLAEVQSEGKQSKELINSLADLCRNISAIETSLSRAGNPEELAELADSTLRDSEPQNLSDMWLRLRHQFTPASRRFRHGLRLSIGLFLGYVLLHLLNLPQGYWVMLTTVFVCQPNFSSTWARLGQRISGTVVGLLVTTLFISAFPHPLAQLALLLAAGVAFFATRAERYAFATACITALVLLCFNQFGSSYALIWPRLLDTLLGCLLAVGVVAFILPDWQSRRLHRVMAHALDSTAVYLSEILRQYHSGKIDDMSYRIVRREAHNADAELSNTLTSMLGEPGRYKLAPDAAYRFLCSSHTLLGYVSALGAHRERVLVWQHEEAIRAQETRIQDRLTEIATALATHTQMVADAHFPHVSLEAASPSDDIEGVERRVMRQLALIESHLPELANLANEFPS